jgi:hypothetical protein
VSDSRIARLAARVGLTEGQLYTLTIGVVLVVLSLAIAFPALHDVRP